MNAYYAPRSRERFFERTSVRLALAVSFAGSLAIAAQNGDSRAATPKVAPSCSFSSETKDFTFSGDDFTISHAVYKIDGVDPNTCLDEAQAVVSEQLRVSDIPQYGETIQIPISVTKR